MKDISPIIIGVITLFLIGVIIRNTILSDKKVEQAFEKGVARGKAMCNGTDSVTLEGSKLTIWAIKSVKDSFSMTFDSTWIIHYRADDFFNLDISSQTGDILTGKKLNQK